MCGADSKSAPATLACAAIMVAYAGVSLRMRGLSGAAGGPAVTEVTPATR